MKAFWDEVKVVLVLGIWYEAWAVFGVEAQIRGIRVISSKASAVPEAKLGCAVQGTSRTIDRPA